MGVKRTQSSGKVDSLGREIKVSGNTGERAGASSVSGGQGEVRSDFPDSTVPAMENEEFSPEGFYERLVEAHSDPETESDFEFDPDAEIDGVVYEILENQSKQKEYDLGVSGSHVYADMEQARQDPLYRVPMQTMIDVAESMQDVREIVETDPSYYERVSRPESYMVANLTGDEVIEHMRRRGPLTLSNTELSTRNGYDMSAAMDSMRDEVDAARGVTRDDPESMHRGNPDDLLTMYARYGRPDQELDAGGKTFTLREVAESVRRDSARRLSRVAYRSMYDEAIETVEHSDVW